MNSGLSHVFIDTSGNYIGNGNSSSLIEISYSRSEKKIADIIYTGNRTKIIDKPWCELSRLGGEIPSDIDTNDCNILIPFVGCSINYFAKYLSSYFHDSYIKLNDLDINGGESRIITNNYLCQLSIEHQFQANNPYMMYNTPQKLGAK